MTEPLAFEAIGTSWKIDLPAGMSPERRSELMRAISARIGVFDLAYSRFRSDSLVSRMAAAPGTYALPDDAGPMMEVYRKLYDLTDGRFTPLIGQVLVDAGYDATYSLKPSPLSRPPRWDDVLAWRPRAVRDGGAAASGPELEIKKPALLDFGAAGKGHLIDLVGEVLVAHGISSFMIDAGQDILHRNADGLRRRIGLEHPLDFGQVVGVVELGNASICGSAGNRRAWADYHHIIDPATLMSPRHLLASWAIADSALVADAVATALFFVGPETLAPHFDFEYLCLYPDMVARHSSGFNGALFS